MSSIGKVALGNDTIKALVREKVNIQFISILSDYQTEQANITLNTDDIADYDFPLGIELY